MNMHAELQWYRGYDTGISSETIFEVMTGVPVRRHSVPLDPDDFGRCYRLLRKFPGWRQRMPEVSERFAEWGALIENFDALWDLYEEERYDELYDLMRKARSLDSKPV